MAKNILKRLSDDISDVLRIEIDSKGIETGYPTKIIDISQTNLLFIDISNCCSFYLLQKMLDFHILFCRGENALYLLDLLHFEGNFVEDCQLLKWCFFLDFEYFQELNDQLETLVYVLTV